jgi:hypothetical protein
MEKKADETDIYDQLASVVSADRERRMSTDGAYLRSSVTGQILRVLSLHDLDDIMSDIQCYQGFELEIKGDGLPILTLR